MVIGLPKELKENEFQEAMVLFDHRTIVEARPRVRSLLLRATFMSRSQPQGEDR